MHDGMAGNYYGTVIGEIEKGLADAVRAAGFPEVNLHNEIAISEKGFGDISCPVAFKLAKLAKRNPVEIAEQVAKSMHKADCVREIRAEGGFINIYLERKAFSKGVISGIEAPSAQPQKPQPRIIIEYPSVNPNKPWHIGHLRNALIGDTISNAYAKRGYSVERENYIDDLGLQVIETLWGYMNLSREPTKKYDHWLGELYVKVNELMKERDIKDELARLLELVEQDGTYESSLAREMAEKCVAAQYETAFNYGICHDILVWESDIIRSRIFDRAMELLHSKRIVRKEEGGKYANCTIMDLSDTKKLPESMRGLKETAKVLIRSNGASTYVAKDIAFHMWKFGLVSDPFMYSEFMAKQPNGKVLYTTSGTGKKGAFGNVQRAVNVIDIEQTYAQGIVRLAFSLMGRNDIADNIIHLAYNVVELESGAFSGRKGTWMGYTADDLLAEARSRAAQLISGRLKLTEGERMRVTEGVALAAVKFEMLRISPERKIIFSWEKALNFEGISGPYCQYMYARATRILEGATGAAADFDPAFLEGDAEFELVKAISKADYIVEKACLENRPNVVTDYAGALAVEFSKFYERVPVLKAPTEEERKSKLALVHSFKLTMEMILRILGIPPLERM